LRLDRLAAGERQRK